MSKKTSVVITYWAYPLENGKMEDFAEIDTFEKNLSQDFNVFVSGKPSDAMGGGLYELTIRILHNENVQDALLFSSGILADTVRDLFKDRIKDFLTTRIGTPIKQAFAKLKEANLDKDADIERVEVQFKDVCLIIYNVCQDGIAKNLDIILDLFDKRFSEFIVDDQLPSYVYVPLFRDDNSPEFDWKNKPTFRKLESVDETIRNVGDDAYLNYWGIFYTFIEDQCKIYNVRTKEIIDANIFSPDFGTL